MPKPLDRNEIRRAFAVTIRELRAQKEIAQETLAYTAGVDRGYMGALERGAGTPTLDTVFKLLPVLDVNFVEFAVALTKNLNKRPRRQRLGPLAQDPADAGRGNAHLRADLAHGRARLAEPCDALPVAN